MPADPVGDRFSFLDSLIINVGAEVAAGIFIVSAVAMGRAGFAIVPILGIAGNLAFLYFLDSSGFGLTVAFGIMLVGSIYYTYGKVLVLPKGAATALKETPAVSEIREFIK